MWIDTISRLRKCWDVKVYWTVGTVAARDARKRPPPEPEGLERVWKFWEFWELFSLQTLFGLESGQAHHWRSQKATMKGLRVWRVTAYGNFSSDFVPTSEWPGPPQKKPKGEKPKGHDEGTEGLESYSLRKLFLWLSSDFRVARPTTKAAKRPR